MTDDRPDPPEFGPSGYLPDRAAKRARKIVLRAPLGLQWVVASMVAGLVVLVAGVLFLRSADAGPQPPFEPVASIDELGAAEPIADGAALIVTAGGRVRVFDVPGAAEVGYCPDSHRLESTDGRVWSLTGRGLGGAASLAEHPSVVFDGRLFVDLGSTVEGPTASDEPAEPACGGPQARTSGA